MPAPTITALPAQPGVAGPFSSDEADAFVGAFPDMITEMNAQAAWRDIHDRITLINGLAAQDLANPPKWVTATSYARGDVVWSPTDYFDYVRVIAGAGSTDPASDPTNWQRITGSGNATLTGAESWTNKTLKDVTIQGALTEEVYTIVDGASVDIDPANGSIQLWYPAASRTPTASSFANGQEITLFAYKPAPLTITWPSVTWVNGVEPLYDDEQFAVIVLSKRGGALEGKYVGLIGDIFWPTLLFANGEQGAWYDHSDLTTMFQDSAGVTPASVGQPVGLHLDKSKGLVVGAELLGAGTIGINGTAVAATYNTSTGEGSVSRNTDAANQSYVRFSSLSVGGFHKITIANTGSPTLLVRSGTESGTAWATLASGQSGSYYVPADSAGRITLTALNNASTATFTVTSFKHIAGNHRYQTTAASRPILRQSGSLYYLKYDGVDDFLVTNAIDFSGSDKITVWAGVRKLSDATRGVLVELSATIASNNGGFILDAPGTTPADERYRWQSKGTSAAVTPVLTTPAAPVTSVLTGIGDIGADTCILRVDGAEAVLASTNQGTGNFGNYPVYFGRRGGASLPFNGHEYGVIIRGGASDAAMINLVEAWMNAKTGAY